MLLDERLVAGDDLDVLKDAGGERFLIGTDLIVAGADLAEFELSDFSEGFADAVGFSRLDTGHLQEDAIAALAGDDRLGGAHAVEALFNDFDGLFHLGRGDRHFHAVFTAARLDVQGE